MKRRRHDTKGGMKGGEHSWRRDENGEGGKERERKDDMKGRGRIIQKRKGEDCLLKGKGKRRTIR